MAVDLFPSFHYNSFPSKSTCVLSTFCSRGLTEERATHDPSLSSLPRSLSFLSVAAWLDVSFIVLVLLGVSPGRSALQSAEHCQRRYSQSSCSDVHH